MNNLSIWHNRVRKFVDHPPAILAFLKKKFYYNFVADKYLKYYRDFKYLTYEETISEIIDNNKSIVRFGDEIFDMLQGIGLYYGNWRQRYDHLLALRLKEVVSSRDPRLLVCFNPELILKNKKDFNDAGIPEQYDFWTNSKIYLKDYYHKDVVYGSALCFNPRYNHNINYSKIRDFFLTKKIIIVTSNTHRFQDVSLGKTTTFLEAPQSDAWQSYDEIHTSLLNLIQKQDCDKRECLILVSMGSAAKVLVYDLTNEGYVAWDTGQFFDLAFEEIKKISSS